MMFAIALVPLLLVTGMAIDGGRAYFARTMMNEAADAAVLAGGRAMMVDPSLTETEAEAIARRYFDAHLGDDYGVAVVSFDFQLDGGQSKFSVTAGADMPTMFLGVIGKKTLPINTYSEANAQPPRPLEVALVLDTTGSMEGAKLSALKDAARDMARDLMTGPNANAKVGVVPFAQYVNVGVSRRNEPWMNVPADYREPRNVCRTTYPNATRTNCRTVTDTCTETERTNCRNQTRTCSRTTDGVTSSYSCTTRVCDESTREYQCQREVCDENRGAPVEQCEIAYTDFKFHGCVGSRDHPLNVEDKDFDVTPAPGLMNVTCGPELTPLTANHGQVQSAISNLSADGSTYIPAGLAWGHRLVSMQAPFSEGEDFGTGLSARGVKAIVLMTDGENTRSPDYPEHRGSNASLSNDLVDEACDNIKKEGIMLFTIAFEVSDTATRDMLRRCAANADSYFDATDADRLADAFASITMYLQEISLTK
ncbi:MAG: VWA domain-containing protein [Alphaproteobacteria bacterium]|nr:VWA domain-containing protein [Alphaproteobacteria bacterium]